MAPDAKVAAALTDDDLLVRTPGSLDGRVGEAWHTRTGAEGRPAKWASARSASRPACDMLGCAITLEGRKVSVLTGPGDAGDDCRHAELVIDLVADRRCPAPVVSIGRRQLLAGRGTEIDLGSGSFCVPPSPTLVAIDRGPGLVRHGHHQVLWMKTMSPNLDPAGLGKRPLRRTRLRTLDLMIAAVVLGAVALLAATSWSSRLQGQRVVDPAEDVVEAVASLRRTFGYDGVVHDLERLRQDQGPGRTG